MPEETPSSGDCVKDLDTMLQAMPGANQYALILFAENRMGIALNLRRDMVLVMIMQLVERDPILRMALLLYLTSGLAGG